MKTIRLLTGVVALLCVFASSATSANAWFEANTSGATTGAISKFPATTTFVDASATVNCASSATTKATGFWTIQTATETNKAEPLEITQPATKLGPHEAITIQKWGTCNLEAPEAKIPAEVKECRLQVAQPTKSTAAEQKVFGSVQTVCSVVVKLSGIACTLTISPGTANNGLTGVVVNPEGTNSVGVKANVPNITAEAKGVACAAAGLPSKTASATFKTGSAGSESIVNEGQKLV